MTATAPDRSTLRFYTDTGGGWNAIGQRAADRLRLRPAGQIDVDGGKRPVVDFPSVLAKAGVPAPMKERWIRGRLVVAPDDRLHGADGSLGSRWFAGSVWQIDYPRQTFSVLRNWNATLADHPMALGFRSGDDGKRAMHFPRITVTIPGRPTDICWTRAPPPSCRAPGPPAPPTGRALCTQPAPAPSSQRRICAVSSSRLSSRLPKFRGHHPYRYRRRLQDDFAVRIQRRELTNV